MWVGLEMWCGQGLRHGMWAGQEVWPVGGARDGIAYSALPHSALYPLSPYKCWVWITRLVHLR